MHHAPRSRTACATLLALASLACTSASRDPGGQADRADSPHSDPQDPFLSSLAEQFERARAARAAQDTQGSRTLIASAIEESLAGIGEREDEPHVELLRKMGRFAYEVGDLRAAERADERVLEIRTRTRPDDDLALQYARMNYCLTIKALGELERARSIEEHILEVFSRTLPEDHIELQKARQNLALTIKWLGEHEAARLLEERVLEVRSRTLPEDHPDLQAARVNLAGTYYFLADYERALPLLEQAIVVLARTSPEDDRLQQYARLNLAISLLQLGDPHRARSLLEQVLEAYSRTLPKDHPDILMARGNLAATLLALGDLQGARTLQEGLLEAYSRTLPEDHYQLQMARLNLGSALAELGETEAARKLYESTLDTCSRTLPEDDPLLQTVRQNLAATLTRLGDHPGARELCELVVASRLRTLPEDHPDVGSARMILASILYELGELPRARSIQEEVLADYSRTFPQEAHEFQLVRRNLAWTIARLAQATASADEREASWERSVELLLACSRADIGAARAALLSGAPREAQARCERLSAGLDQLLSFASGFGVFAPAPELDRASLVLGETTRGAALGAAAMMRRAAGSPAWAELRERLARESDDLAALVRKGATSETFQATLDLREATQREMIELAREHSDGGLVGVDFDPDTLMERLEPGTAAVAVRRYMSTGLEPGQERLGPRLCAFVLCGDDAAAVADRAAAALTRVDLGPAAPIESAVQAWREALGVGEGRGIGASVSSRNADLGAVGAALRRLVFDPLLPATKGAARIVFVLDDALHLVPVDALPLDGADELVGDRWRIETRCTLAELLAPAAPPLEGGTLVALGAAAFSSEPSAAEAREAEEPDAAGDEVGEGAAILRGGAWERGFTPLPATGLEARELARLHREALGNARPASNSSRGDTFVLEARKASRAALTELAPRARWLHVATHGWFASESIRSWQDDAPLDAVTGLAARMSGEEQVRGMSPMLLCGLALAGANLPEDTVGRIPGLITAEEIAALDLSKCELAVLSACDTNVGERRAGQGVASLQQALQMAGTRSVITSLWKVPDEATRQLMVDFYRRLWLKNEPKFQALWEAKRTLREAKDEQGRPRYSTRDWAAWVLTGEPD